MSGLTLPDFGGPELTTEEIEAEIEKMRGEVEATERWLSARARRKMDEMAGDNKRLREAFLAGYRLSNETNFWSVLTPVIFGLVVAQALSLANGQGWFIG